MLFNPLYLQSVGSGKTAAFAFPILQELSKDPYGIFAVVLTPTRELAVQISEQFAVFGVSLSLRIALIIGGVDITEQGLKLAKRPHIVIGTPGRLRYHLEGPTPPNLSKTRYLVLDECDRLLATGFQAELKCITSSMGPNRQTLLFSATMTSSLQEIEKVAMKETLRFDLTVKKKLPSNLSQEYLFMPYKVKGAYLGALLQKLALEMKSDTQSNDDEKIKGIVESISNAKSRKRPLDVMRSKRPESLEILNYSIMIFVGTCKKAQELTEILTELNINCVALHSLLSQDKRLKALSKFKNQHSRILVATDVASRGLDIPSVDLVINYDLPKVLSDYIHRVGRTARAGRGGRAVSFVTQHDVEIVHSLEDFIGQKMVLATDIDDNDAVKLLNKISKATRVAQQKLLESGFDEKVELLGKRRKKQRRQLLRKKVRLDIGSDATNSS